MFLLPAVISKCCKMERSIFQILSLEWRTQIVLVCVIRIPLFCFVFHKFFGAEGQYFSVVCLYLLVPENYFCLAILTWLNYNGVALVALSISMHVYTVCPNKFWTPFTHYYKSKENFNCT